MKTDATVGVLLATDVALNEALPLDRLSAAIRERGWVLKTVAAEHVARAIEVFEDLCRNERPAGVVIAGPALALDGANPIRRQPWPRPCACSRSRPRALWFASRSNCSRDRCRNGPW